MLYLYAHKENEKDGEKVKDIFEDVVIEGSFEELEEDDSKIIESIDKLLNDNGYLVDNLNLSSPSDETTWAGMGRLSSEHWVFFILSPVPPNSVRFTLDK